MELGNNRLFSKRFKCVVVDDNNSKDVDCNAYVRAIGFVRKLSNSYVLYGSRLDHIKIENGRYKDCTIDNKNEIKKACDNDAKFCCISDLCEVNTDFNYTLIGCKLNNKN